MTTTTAPLVTRSLRRPSLDGPQVRPVDDAAGVLTACELAVFDLTRRPQALVELQGQTIVGTLNLRP